MLISSIGLLEPIQNQDHGIIPGCSGNPYRFIHTKCPLSLFILTRYRERIKGPKWPDICLQRAFLTQPFRAYKSPILGRPSGR